MTPHSQARPELFGTHPVREFGPPEEHSPSDVDDGVLWVDWRKEMENAKAYEGDNIHDAYLAAPNGKLFRDMTA